MTLTKPELSLQEKLLQKPKAVLQALQDFYTTSNANIHRGIHTLSEEATAQYEDVRRKVAKFIGAPSEENIIFTKNTTESINCIRLSWADQHIKAGDEIFVGYGREYWEMMAKLNGGKKRS